MGLKKNYFKGLQSGVNHSPLKMHHNGLDKKKVKVEDERNVVVQDNLQLGTPKFNSLKTFKAQEDVKSFLDNQKRTRF